MEIAEEIPELAKNTEAAVAKREMEQVFFTSP